MQRQGSLSKWRLAAATAARVALFFLALPAAHAARPDLCASGQRQSPVDIVAPRPAALPPLAFAYRSAPLRIVNDGHTVRVRFANGSRMSIGGEALTLQQFHFHLPGGERIRGEEFPLGMHFLHKSAAGQLVVLVVLFRLGGENPVLATLLPHLTRPGTPERVVADASADALGLIPREHGYYSYEGSETAPPCTEGVRWLVMKQAQEASAAQLEALQRLIPRNARAVQPLNGRVVQERLP